MKVIILATDIPKFKLVTMYIAFPSSIAGFASIQRPLTYVCSLYHIECTMYVAPNKVKMWGGV